MNYNNLLFFFAGLSVTLAYDDLSFKKIAIQSHTSLGTNNDAWYALDRNESTCMRTNPIGLHDPDKTVWWKVDLGGVYSIYSIHIMFKNYPGYEKRQRGRFAGFSLNVSNTDLSKTEVDENSTLCYKDGPLLPFLHFTTTTCAMIGRYVTFYNERFDKQTFPAEYEVYNVFTELCEVFIFACRKRWYGVNCSQQCSGHCRNNTPCHHVTGQCDRGCDAGWTGAFCDQECPFGLFGMDCRERCSGHCKNNESCHHIFGLCRSGCQDGYNGTRCDDSCMDGYHGSNCSLVCSSNCKTCRHTDGLCTCKTGWTGLNCTTECNDGTYGYSCTNICSGHCLNDSPCNKRSGHCDGGCNPGYTNIDCNKGTNHKIDDESNYQELSESKGDNTYQTLTLQ
uniref:Multiple epidermal growth factor-like domains 10 n=1 Tax=Magallana gigas TaxID=29159 RepID=K1RI85_MAGGI